MKRLDKIAPGFKQGSFNQEEPSLNEVHEQFLKLQQTFGVREKVDGSVFTPYESCLHQLVRVLGWDGDERHLMEALPHLEAVRDLSVLQMVLLQIGYRTTHKKVSLLARSNNIYPCLVDFDDGPVIVLKAARQGEFDCINAQGPVKMKLNQLLKGQTLILIEALDTETGKDERQSSWFFGALLKLRKPIYGALFLTCIANVLILATPLYTMNVYNRVIGGQALDTLAYFFVGVCLIIAFEVMVRRKRGRLLSYIGAKLDAEITNKVFKQVLTLPVMMTETASINRQIVQFRQFEAIRDLLTGNLFSTLLDLPFLLLFFAVIALLSGWLVVIPLVLVSIFAVMAIVLLPTMRRRGRKSGVERSQFNQMSMELANKMQAVRELGAEDLWLSRHSRAAQVSAHSMFRTRFFDTFLQTVAQSLVMLAGLATIAIGSYLVMDGTIDTGALIAIMMIVWRILTPIQITFLSLNRIGQLQQTVQHLDRLMKISRERRFKGKPHSLRSFNGALKFDNVSFRYGPKSEPVLKGVNFSVEHGEVVALTGATGSGKSTILKILLGLYQPQAGRVFLDNINIQQLDVGELRSSMGFMPQVTSLFYGSLAQNLLLSNPLANRQEILEALAMAGVTEEDPLLEGGLDRPLRFETGDLNDNDVARIALARSYLVKGSVLLLDNPGIHFDNKTDRHFIEQLQAFKGKKTVILVTSRPSHIQVCDRLLQMHNGMLVNDADVESYMRAMKVQGKAG